VHTKTVVNIVINQHHYKAPAAEITGAELKQLASIPAANLLFREVRGPGEDELIQDDKVVHLHDGDLFYDMPQGNFGAA
jgi:hypothetical protein